MAFWIIQILNGLSFSMMLFLIAAGFTLVFGLMKIINIAHGSFYLLGAYIGLTILRTTGSFLLATIASSIAAAVVGIAMQSLFLRRFYMKELQQVLLTFGFVLIIADVCLWIWGGNPLALPKPSIFKGSIWIGGVVFPTYRLLVILIGVIIAVGLWIFQEKTKFGAIVRAGVDDEEMLRGSGINIQMVFIGVFGLGALLAGIGGIIGGPFVGVFPGVDITMLLLALVVVIIGGVGSLRGAFVGSLFVGLVDNFGKALFPELSLFTLFAPMAIILAIRPTGIFGKIEE
jgi:branched-chain amino acid transport system permease protein